MFPSALSRSVSGFFLTVAVLAAPRPADAGDEPKKYHFELQAVTATAKVKPDDAKVAKPRVEAEVKKVVASHPQLVKLEGAPNPKANPDVYLAYLAAHHIAGAYDVSVEITEATETLSPAADKSGKRLEVRLALRMIGVHVPDSTLGFSGSGKTTIKMEFSGELSKADREETWSSAAEVAVGDAMKTALEELAKPAKTKKKH